MKYILLSQDNYAYDIHSLVKAFFLLYVKITIRHVFKRASKIGNPITIL